MIENHVTSLELSKLMNEFGFNKKSLFKWIIHQNPYEKNLIYRNEVRIMTLPDFEYNAYLATELIECLPKSINNRPLKIVKTEECIVYTDKTKDIAKYCVYYQSDINPNKPLKWIEEELLQNALAKMLIYLIENKLMEVDK